jgi:HAD superfamily hydrolase (TIGR01509 family)
MTQAVIFDVDGTIVDSVDLHGKAWQEAFRRFGHEIAFYAIRSQIGKGGDQLMPEFLDADELDAKGEQIEEFGGKLFNKKYLPQVKAFPGVRALFEKIKANGQKLALASSAKKDELSAYERIANIEDLVQVKTSSGDAEKSKPHPDIFEAAIQRLNSAVPRENIIVVGDSPHDAEAAGRANLRTVGVLCGGFPEHVLREAGCIAIYSGPDALLQRYDESPLAPMRNSEAAAR